MRRIERFLRPSVFRSSAISCSSACSSSVIVGGTEVTFDNASKRGTALGKTNVIPREVRVEGDLRYLGAAQFEAAQRKMQRIVTENLPRTSATLSIVNDYPSMAPNPGSERVLAQLDRVSRDLGAEPIVAQPVFLNFDERGRMWVAQYIQYPFPAGLKVVKYDEYLRAVFDKVPPPPVRGRRCARTRRRPGDGPPPRVRTTVRRRAGQASSPDAGRLHQRGADR